MPTIEIQNQCVVEEVFLKVELWFEVEFVLIEPANLIMKQVSGFETKGEADWIFEWAQ